MIRAFMKGVACACMALGLSSCGQMQPAQPPKMEIGEVQVSPEITLRRLVYRPARPKGTVLFLYGFPETIYSWKGIAQELSSDYEVHAFDWPGYGQSSRPSPERFAYSPRDYAQVLKDYIRTSGIDTSRLVIYGTDIGTLPALLAALDDPHIAKRIIAGDFAPFNRPQYMQENLQALKAKPSSDVVHAAMNKGRDEIVRNAYRRGFAKEEQFDLPQEVQDDWIKGWGSPPLTAADAFYHYYSYFTRDQDYFEANLARLKTPLTVVWGERDFYIKKEMGKELAERTGARFVVLPKMGHYPHLQNPKGTVDEVRAAFVEEKPASGY